MHDLFDQRRYLIPFRSTLLPQIFTDTLVIAPLDYFPAEFDAIYTAQDVGSYKPNPANFEYMLKHIQDDLGIKAEGILHTAQSLFHDHVQAKKNGLACAWIARQGLADGGSWGATAVVPERPEVEFRFSSMMEMARAVAAA